MKKICYHGTKADNLDSILKNGLIPQDYGNTLWSCSGDSVYAWAVPDFAKREGEEDEERATELTKNQAADSACFAMVRAKDCRRIVIEFDYSNLDWECDNSCPNMEGAISLASIPPEKIKRIWRDKESLEPLRGLFLAQVADRDLFNDLDLSPIERIARMAWEQSFHVKCEAQEYIDELSSSMELIYENGVVLETKKML